MNYTSSITLILHAITDVGTSMLAIVGAVLVVAVGYLIFKFGWARLAHDQSLEIGGYYVRNLPFKGYHRFRSKSWNMAHMP